MLRPIEIRRVRAPQVIAQGSVCYGCVEKLKKGEAVAPNQAYIPLLVGSLHIVGYPGLGFPYPFPCPEAARETWQWAQ